jgi:uncharacterized protein YjiS (DUF1127 family)
MWYERPWHGNAVVTPVCGWSDHEDSVFEGFGGRSWDEADSRVDRVDAGSAAVKERIRHLEPVRAAYLGHRGPTQDRVVAERAETEQTDFTDRPTWSSSIASRLAGLWSRIRRHREICRIKAASGMIDDRTLTDIGVSRYEIEYSRDARHWH